MRKAMKRITSVVLASVLALSLTACGSKGTQETTDTKTDSNTATSETAKTETAETASTEIIKIGFLTPLSGPNANYGKECLAGAQMVVDLINEANPDYSMALAKDAGLPNLNGAKIELVVADSKSDAAIGTSEAKRLISEEGCVAITGQFTSAMTKTVAVVTEQYGIPLLTAGSSPSLTAEDSTLEWYFRFGPNDSTYIEDSYKYLDYLNETKNAGIKTVALVSEDTEFGANIVKEEVKFAEQYGYEIVENITYSANATNLSSEVMKLKTANPDVIFMASYTSDAILYVKTFKEQNYTPKMILGQRGGFINTDFFSALGNDTEYIYSTAGWGSDLPVETSQQVLALYKDKYSEGISLSEGHVKDLTNVLILAIAINQAGTTESEAIREALKNLQVDISTLFIPWAGITINEHGQNTSANSFIQQIQNGKYATVFPEESKAVDAVFPTPNWDER